MTVSKELAKKIAEAAPVYYESVERHVLYGYNGQMGGFLTALFSNNLVDTFGKADSYNSAHLREWVQWLYNRVPARAWGKDFQSWKGLLGTYGVSSDDALEQTLED